MNTIVPFWLAAGVATVSMVVLAAHLLALNRAVMEPRRKRIRLATSLLMMVIVPLLAYGFGVARTAEPRAFVYVWTVIPALLLMVIVLAVLDMLNTLAISRRQRRGPGPPANTRTEAP
ncbi:MAG: hypothetical protein IT437_00760 [Phycisphaerales bacterium]|nr:hypothetical protein [Phycisphaerales bacterium]